MTRAPIRIRTFLLGTVIVLLVLPTLVGGAAWLVEHHHQQAAGRRRRNTAIDYLTLHRARIDQPGVVRGFSRLVDRLDLLAQVVLVSRSPPQKAVLYVSPTLDQRQPHTPRAKAAAVAPGTPRGWIPDRRRLIVAGTAKAPATLVVDLYRRPESRSAPALVALLSGIAVLFAGLAVAVWLVGRWMVAPLASLSAEVDKVAGGDLAIAVPRSRIGEIANIAQAVEGMTGALGETARRRAEADEARRFLVTSIAHDLRTPLFALRGHLQALGSGVGNPVVHRERAEARADALERLVGNLFAFTRDDDAQADLHLEAVSVVKLLEDVTTGLEHAARIRNVTFELDGDRETAVTVDRERVKRALTNILDNALRYSPPGAAVELGWQALDDSRVELAVRDHGDGIDPDLLPHVFEPGIRGTASGAGQDGGAGLGLAIAKRLLEHQGAGVAAHTRADGGAEIRITLPAV